jgi:outer membrane autotransporter protein
LGAGTVMLGSGTLTAGTANSTVFSGAISGTGAFTKAGAGTLVLTGANTFTGPTIVNAGTLLVNGSSVSPTTVNAGATLGGTGTTGPLINRGTFSPGNSIGTVTVNGNLTFLGAGNYLVEISPTAADRTNVTASAVIGGTLRAVFAPGTYNFQKTYTILSATGGRSGVFDTFLPTGLSGLVTPIVTYTANEVLLSVAPNLAAFAGPTVNAQSVASALNAGLLSAGDPGAFNSLLQLAPDALPNVLSQLSGEVATGVPTESFKVMDQFLGLMLDPFLETRLGDGTTAGRALGLAPEAEATVFPAALSAFGPMVTKAPPASLIDRRWTVWGAAYGAQGKFDGDAIIGSHRLDARNGGFAGGVDYRVSRDTVFGAAMTGAATNWTLDGLAGSGRGETVQVGAYASTKFDNAYVSAAFAYGRHDITTDRTVAFPGVFDRLSAGFAADSYGGRIEAGYRFALGQGFGITPYGAFQALSLHTPAYAERDLSGLAAFALTYAGKTTTDLRSELGARLDSRMALDNGATLILRGRAAWGHGFDTDRSMAAIFQTLPGAGFTVIGAAAVENAALVSAGAELKLRSGVSLSAKFDGEFSDRTTVYAGTGTLRVSW